MAVLRGGSPRLPASGLTPCRGADAGESPGRPPRGHRGRAPSSGGEAAHAERLLRRRDADSTLLLPIEECQGRKSFRLDRQRTGTFPVDLRRGHPLNGDTRKGPGSEFGPRCSADTTLRSRMPDPARAHREERHTDGCRPKFHHQHTVKPTQCASGRPVSLHSHDYRTLHREGWQDTPRHSLRILRSGRLPPRWRNSFELRSSNPRAYPGRLGFLHGCFGLGTHFLHRRARRSGSAIVLRIQAGTNLPSGPRSTIASFGTPEGHSLKLGSPG